MNNSMILSDKELSSICGGLVKEVRKTLSTVAKVALIPMGVVECIKINRESAVDFEFHWDEIKNNRDINARRIGRNTNSKVIEKLCLGYNKCHNAVVDFVRSY